MLFTEKALVCQHIVNDYVIAVDNERSYVTKFVNEDGQSIINSVNKKCKLHDLVNVHVSSCDHNLITSKAGCNIVSLLCVWSEALLWYTHRVMNCKYNASTEQLVSAM